MVPKFSPPTVTTMVVEVVTVPTNVTIVETVMVGRKDVEISIKRSPKGQTIRYFQVSSFSVLFGPFAKIFYLRVVVNPIRAILTVGNTGVASTNLVEDTTHLNAFLTNNLRSIKETPS